MRLARAGYPAYGRHGSTLYSEVEGMQTLLQYKQGKVGGCSVIVHPQWQVWHHLHTKISRRRLSEILFHDIQRFDSSFRCLPSLAQSNMYPASMFTDAPLEAVERACAAARFDARMRWDFAAAAAVDTDSDAPLASNS